MGLPAWTPGPTPCTVHQDEVGFFLWCRGPFVSESDPAPDAFSTEKHYLDGQQDENGELVGVFMP